MLSLETIIEQLQEYYAERGVCRSMDYAYGFFDALGIVRDMQEGRYR